MFALRLRKFSVGSYVPAGRTCYFGPIPETRKLRVDRGDSGTCLESIPTLQMG